MSTQPYDVNFFVNRRWIQNMNFNEVQQLRGHAVIFTAPGANDVSLQISALLDGSSADFLLYPKSIARLESKRQSETIKAYIRSLSSAKQEEIVHFYSRLYGTAVGYHDSVDRLGIMGVCPCYRYRLDESFDKNLDAAYQQLQLALNSSDTSRLNSYR